MHKLYCLSFAGLLFLLLSCNGNAADQQSEEEEVAINTLKEAYKDDFYIGAAINTGQIMGTVTAEESELLAKQFNSITPENTMKWMLIHPKVDSFAFEVPDQYVALGQKNDMKIIGHTLVWHSQLGTWVSEIQDSTELAAQMTNHIRTVVGRYKGKINGWDVVNEALNEDGTLRESIFLQVLGEGYLKYAFDLAAAADPQAELYYNDYNLCQPEKRAGCVAMIKNLQAAGAKIDGVGMQGHWSLNGPSIEEIEESILAYAELGIKVMITELDITVLPNPWDLEGADVNQNFEGSAFMNPYPEALPDSVQIQLADRYEAIFNLFLKHKDKIDRVTFWGVNDGQSWLNGWPIKDRTNYPLLFDRNFQAKNAYHRVVKLKTGS